MYRKKLPKKMLCGLLTGWLLMAGAPALVEAAAVTGSFDSRIYESRLDKYWTMRVYNVEGEDSVPYVSAQQYLSLLYGGKAEFQMEDGGQVLKVVRNGVSVKFDAAQGTIGSDSWDAGAQRFRYRLLHQYRQGPHRIRRHGAGHKGFAENHLQAGR